MENETYSNQHFIGRLAEEVKAVIENFDNNIKSDVEVRLIGSEGPDPDRNFWHSLEFDSENRWQIRSSAIFYGPQKWTEKFELMTPNQFIEPVTFL